MPAPRVSGARTESISSKNNTMRSPPIRYVNASADVCHAEAANRPHNRNIKPLERQSFSSNQAKYRDEQQ